MHKTFKLLYLFLSLFFYSTCASTHMGAQDYKQRGDHKRVLIIADTYEDNRMKVGGLETVLLHVQNGLRDREYEVKLLGSEAWDEFYEKLSLCQKPFAWLYFKTFINQAICEFQPDYIFNTFLGLYAHVAAHCCSELKIPSIGFRSCRGGAQAEEWLNNSKICGVKLIVPLSKFLVDTEEKMLLSWVSKVLVPSASMRDEFTLGGLDAQRVVAWPHGVDLEEFSVPTSEEKRVAIDFCGLNNLPKPFYIWVGRLAGDKNLQAFLDMQLAGTKIVVGPESYDGQIEQLKRECSGIIFAGKQVGLKRLQWYQTADVFVFTSKIDTFGIVMLEALACGLPVVGFNTVGPKDVVPQGCGVSYLANDLDSITELEACAKQAWDDLQVGVVTPKMCRKHASKFSWDAAIDQLEQVFVPTGLTSTVEVC